MRSVLNKYYCFSRASSALARIQVYSGSDNESGLCCCSTSLNKVSILRTCLAHLRCRLWDGNTPEDRWLTWAANIPRRTLAECYSWRELLHCESWRYARAVSRFSGAPCSVMRCSKRHWNVVLRLSHPARPCNVPNALQMDEWRLQIDSAQGGVHEWAGSLLCRLLL